MRRLATAFGEVLKELRNGVGISQETLAYECELDRSFISMMERGIKMPTIETLFKLFYEGVGTQMKNITTSLICNKI